MNGVHVGELKRATGGVLEFRYGERWLSLAGSTPISLSIPLSESALRDEAVATYFDNLMPDATDVRQRLQRAVGSESTRAFDLLEAVGNDCVGALQFHSEESPESVRSIRFEPWTSAQIANHLRDLSSGRSTQGSDRAPFRISIAGAQEKTALLRHENQWCRPIGSTPTTHILKPAIGATAAGVDLSRSVENEWLCSRILKAFGLQAAASEIVDFEDQRVLVVERFDRRLSPDESWWMRLPQEDMCQATGTPAGKKYESDGGPGIRRILALLEGAQSPMEDRLHFLKSQLVFWLLAAIDGHGKNFSLALLPGGDYRLTPLYDVLSAHPAVAAGELHQKELRMAMALEGANRHYRWEEIRPRHWIETAKRAGIPAQQVHQLLDTLLEATPAVASQARADARAIPKEVGEPMIEGMIQATERLKRLL